MSEIENNTQSQKPKTSKLAIASPIFVVLGILVWLLEVLGCTPPMLRFMQDDAFGYFLALSMISAITALIKTLVRVKDSKTIVRNVALAITGIVTCFLAAIICPYINGQIRLRNRMVCLHNLYQLGLAIRIYADDNDGKFPVAHKWCDLLIDGGYVDKIKFKCPGDRKGPCSYAMNINVPELKRDMPVDMVLLFESKPGWNLHGGPELLTTENHDGRGCNVLFGDGHTEWVRKEWFGELKWKLDKEIKYKTVNFRRPWDDNTSRYWLENMVWYHRYTNEEIRAATGLTEKEIITSLKKYDIRPENRPKRAADALLLVMPYPGGRHPRIGFLDDAIDPQRETKFSVFTPWEPSSYSYVVVDVPEAIWSNLGLTYLAHTHIDTIWTKQGIDLPKLEWNRHPDGTLDIERKLPNGIAFGVKVEPAKEAVKMELWLKNGTNKKLSDLRVQNCVMTKMAAGFQQQTNDNKVLTNPYVACRSSDSKRWIITAWENCNQPWANDKCPCFHSDPKFPDLEPGQIYRLQGWLSFYEGTDIKAEFKRIEATGWRNK